MVRPVFKEREPTEIVRPSLFYLSANNLAGRGDGDLPFEFFTDADCRHGVCE